MDPIRILEMVESYRDLILVRIFSVFYTQGFVDSNMQRIKELLKDNALDSLARNFLIWAVVLIVLIFLVDQLFFWMRRENRTRFKQNMRSFGKWITGFGDRAKYAARRFKQALAEEKKR